MIDKEDCVKRARCAIVIKRTLAVLVAIYLALGVLGFFAVVLTEGVGWALLAILGYAWLGLVFFVPCISVSYFVAVFVLKNKNKILRYQKLGKCFSVASVAFGALAWVAFALRMTPFFKGEGHFFGVINASSLVEILLSAAVAFSAIFFILTLSVGAFDKCAKRK